jgi:hypothetical protein
MLLTMTMQIMVMTLMIHTMLTHHTDPMSLVGSSLFH